MRGRRGGVKFTLVLQKLLCGYGIVILRRRHAVMLVGGSGMGGVATLENTIATKPNAILDVSVGKGPADAV